jgi:hypothetical protein
MGNNYPCSNTAAAAAVEGGVTAAAAGREAEWVRRLLQAAVVRVAIAGSQPAAAAAYHRCAPFGNPSAIQSIKALAIFFNAFANFCNVR